VKAFELTNFQVVLDHPTVLTLTHADVEADDEQWGRISLAEAQERLVKEDDLAILVLRTDFESEGELRDMTIEVNANGLRLLEVDGTYLVPRSGEAPEGFERYELPSPLEPGYHEVQWSFVWNPPVDSGTGEEQEDGVTLQPLRIQGRAAGRHDKVFPAPSQIALDQLEESGLGGIPEGLGLVREIEIPSEATELRLEGPGAESFQPLLDDHLLPAMEAVGCFRLPPATDGPVTLTLRAKAPSADLTAIRCR